MNKEISLVIEKYIESMQPGKFHRYESWDICREAFCATKKMKTMR